MNEQEQLLAAVTVIGAVGWWLATVLFVAWRAGAHRADLWKRESGLNWDRWRCTDGELRRVEQEHSKSWERSSDSHSDECDEIRDRFIDHLKDQLAAMQKVILPSDPEDDE